VYRSLYPALEEQHVLATFGAPEEGP
jgi:hypothetical protein